MGLIDIDALLAEVNAASPCGANLEYAPEFSELERAVQGKPEVQYGGTITPAVPPDWKAVKRLATDLLQRSRDLRIIVPLLRAVLALDGIAAMSECLRLIQRLLEERWDSVHPQLDVDDDFDPTLRLNSLAVLADDATLVREVRAAPFLTAPGLGPISVRDLDIASGELQPIGEEARLGLASIEAAIHDIDADRMAQAIAALQMAFDSTRQIEALLVVRVGSSQALNLDPLTRVLARGCDFLVRAMRQAHGALDRTPSTGHGQPQWEGSPVTTAPGLVNSDIHSRDDVLRMLEKICEYYRRHEPSSPVPLLLERARRLVTKNFIEIMADLAPDGMAQLTMISGAPPSQE